MIVVGIDPHKRTYTAAALDADGQVLGSRTFGVGPGGIAALARRVVDWGAALTEQQDDQQIHWALEGGPGLGGRLADWLLQAAWPVVWVPAKRMAARRALLASTGAKSDAIDAQAVAHVALADGDLRVHRVQGPLRELRAAVDARADLVTRRTQAINQLKAEAHMRLELEDLGDLTRSRTRQRLGTHLEAHAGALGRVLGLRLDEIERLSADIATLEAEIAALAGPRTHHLRALVGVGMLTAARLLATIGDIDRFPTHDALASYTGCSPIPVFTSNRHRMRLNRGGNRHLNCAIHTIALAQRRHHTPAATFLDQRIPTKGTRGAYRALKRHLVRTIHTAMRTDAAMHTPTPPDHTLAA